MIHHPCILKSKTPHTPQYEVCVFAFFIFFDNCHAKDISHMVPVLWSVSSELTVSLVYIYTGGFKVWAVYSNLYKAALITVYGLPSTRGCIVSSNIFTIFAFSHEGSVYMLMPDLHPWTPRESLSLLCSTRDQRAHFYLLIQWVHRRRSDSSHTGQGRWLSMQIACGHSCSTVSPRLLQCWRTNCTRPFRI